MPQKSKRGQSLATSATAGPDSRWGGGETPRLSAKALKSSVRGRRGGRPLALPPNLAKAARKPLDAVLVRDQVFAAERLSESCLQPEILLRILNQIFRTACNDVDAIDGDATWPVIVEELKPQVHFAPVLAMRYHGGISLEAASHLLGLSRARICLDCGLAIRKLRHPLRLARIRSSILGWPNLYREAVAVKSPPPQR